MVRPLDLTGKKFGKLTALKRVGSTKNGGVLWLCECECGNEVVVRRSNLRSGNSESCGCSRDKPPSNFIDLTGKKFERLVVIKKAGKTKSGNITWLCKCSCGKETVATGSELINGHVKSCGCYNRECISKRMVKILTTHGGSRTRLYAIHRGMKDRCSNPHNKRYKHYGGRGIKVCEEWQRFELFRDWALANGYSDDLTIDRIDSNGNYEPSNCRWIDNFAQQSNRTNNHHINFNGKTLTLAQWTREMKLNKSTLQNRLQAGWNIEDALVTPIKTPRRSLL